MEQTQMKKRLKATVIIAIIAAIILGMCGSFMAFFLNRAVASQADAQIQNEAEEYVNRLNRRMRMDFQVLRSMASLIMSGNLYESAGFAWILDNANWENAFTTMMYFDMDGHGVGASKVSGVYMDIELAKLHTECRKVIRKSMEGAACQSQPFPSQFSDDIVFAYSVPVYRDTEVIGVLAGSNNVETFSEILAGGSALGDNGYIHLVNPYGEIILPSTKIPESRQTNTIFGAPFFEPKQVAEVRHAMRDGKEHSFAFKENGENYRGLIEPVGINDWSLFCISETGKGTTAMNKMAAVILGVFSCILALVVFLMVYGYHTLDKNHKQLTAIAYRDRLSGLYNREGFLRKTAEAIEVSSDFSIAIINVHQFKFINEIFGQEKADEMLCLIADTIQKDLRDEEFACRDSGDSFYIFLREGEKDKIEKRLLAITKDIEKKSIYNNSNYQLRFYCGCVIADEDTVSDINKLLTHLVFTLSKAREARGEGIHFYDDSLYEKMQIENYIETHMQQALDGGEFQMFMQPKVSLKDGSLKSAEALVRWISRDGRRIFPDQFIPLFENNGFCVKLDMYMVDCACRQIREWIDQGIEPIGISVNQTKLLFYESHYIERMKKMIEKYQIPAELITLEILEGIAIDDVNGMNRKIDKLKKIGFRISMDDFGSGYSSLNTLSKIHIDELKIDREFLRELSEDKEHRIEVVLEQIIHMTVGLNISTVVEGVETKEQEELVRNLGCDYGQGYYYSRPIDQKQFNLQYMEQRKKY